jgi:hypothetical protein
MVLLATLMFATLGSSSTRRRESRGGLLNSYSMIGENMQQNETHYQLIVNGVDKGFFDSLEDAWNAIPEDSEYEIRELPIEPNHTFDVWLDHIKKEMRNDGQY